MSGVPVSPFERPSGNAKPFHFGLVDAHPHPVTELNNDFLRTHSYDVRESAQIRDCGSMLCDDVWIPLLWIPLILCEYGTSLEQRIDGVGVGDANN